MAHDTQETTAWYGQHAKGLHKILNNPWDATDTRYVFTTRSDRCISINVQLDGTFVLYPNSAVQQKVEPKSQRPPAPAWPPMLLNSAVRGLSQK